ncbi:hypothetical protein AVEN_119696-1 [Araneus ventricosus]|uniref:Uncharacterized protein n=1 Tax=Araneus ventricosus TaxID=182803 RepID=A0A4Y2J0S5_ARAVE|nr:hypothetical protein AVEN_119696-1 [Araneus ventricosus]
MPVIIKLCNFDTDSVLKSVLGWYPSSLIKAHSYEVTHAQESNGPYASFGFESIEKQLWRNKQNDRPISDSEIKAVRSQLFKTDQWLPPAGHVSEDVTSHA